MIKRLLQIIAILILFAVLIWFFSTRASLYREMPCRQLQIVFIDTNKYLSEEFFIHHILKHYGNPVGKSMDEIDIRAIHKVLRDIPHLKDVQIYKTPDAVLMIEIRLRKPLMRVYDLSGRDYLVDAEGYIMPEIAELPLWTLCVSGYVPSLNRKYWGKKIDELDTVQNLQMAALYYAWLVALAFERYNSVEPLISQIVVKNKDEFWLIPAVSNLIIRFGSSQRIDEKIGQLEVLLRDVLPHIPSGKYEVVDITIPNQFIMKKTRDI